MNRFDETGHITMNELSFNGRTGIAQVMQIFQEAVTEHTKVLGIGADRMLADHNAKWVITRVRFEIADTLGMGDEFRVSTWPLKAKALRFGRSFILESGGRRIVSAYTEWCIIDASTQEALRSSTIAMPIDEYLTDTVTECGFSKARAEYTEDDMVYSRTMRQSDIDLNRHVNNISYIKLALDCFLSEELEALDIKSFEMYYLSQAYEGETLTLYKKDNCIEARCGERPVFRCTFNL